MSDLSTQNKKRKFVALKGHYLSRSTNFIVNRFQSERREKHERANAATLADEVDRVKMEVEQEKAELQVTRRCNFCLKLVERNTFCFWKNS